MRFWTRVRLTLLFELFVWGGLIFLVLTLGACVTDQDVALLDRTARSSLDGWLTDRVYTRAEVDAINNELECRRLARSLLQAQRCGVRR